MSRTPTALWFWPDVSGDDAVVLTHKQWEVFKLVMQGCSYDEIAFELGIHHKTVAQRMKTVQRRLGARNNAHAVATSFRRKIGHDKV
jgi:DNA-binding NarL/FixJ family response regulator